MSGPASAIAYAWGRSTINRLRSQAKRVKNPRYAVAMLIGLAYFYWIFVQNPRASSESGVNPFADLLSTPVTLPIGAALMLVMAARWWLFKSDRSSLAFTAAEVQFLFPAPISRRGLVHAKLVRGQIAIFLNVFIWTMLLRGGATTAAGWQRGIALWLMFSTVALHRLGAALVRTSALEHERAGKRRSIIPATIFMGILAGAAWGFISKWSEIQAATATSPRRLIDTLIAALKQPIPSIALWPAKALLAPVLTFRTEQWLPVIPFSALVLVLHYIWVLRMDASFEEAALEATQFRAEMVRNIRTSGGIRKRSTKGKLSRVPSLSLSGRPEIAITWKNIAAALRGTAWQLQTTIVFIGLTIFAVIAAFKSDDAAEIFVGLCAFWGIMSLIIGPLSMRYDLRHDLPRLAMLKTYPLSGTRIVAAEIGAVTILHSASIWLLMIVPVVMFVIRPSVFPNESQFPVMLAAIAIAIPAFNALTFTVHNGAALLFPGWVRLGTEQRGFEAMGQSLLTIVATSLVAAVALVFPAGLAFLIIWLATAALGVWAMLVAAAAASVLLCLELWPVIFWLGSVFDEIDVADITPAQ